jgi:Squalene-hopene cyclase N-terminal domain/Prenyltransferase and squalene oxidase repeat
MTACVLGRLGELPSRYFTHSQQQQIEESLNWLERLRAADGGWVCGGHDDGDLESTAWAVIALRLHGRTVPEPALQMIRSCRRPDGGFAAHPGQVFRQSALETSALAIRALSQTDSAADDFFASGLQAMDLSSCHATSRYRVFSEILDWELGLASPCLLDKVSKLTPDFGGDSVINQALLLRCLLRLRNRWAWPLAADLRAAQNEDGSWSELEPARPSVATTQAARVDDRILLTVTAVSALVLDEFQPGLYFGSDSPLPPRRLRDC